MILLYYYVILYILYNRYRYIIYIIYDIIVAWYRCGADPALPPPGFLHRPPHVQGTPHVGRTDPAAFSAAAHVQLMKLTICRVILLLQISPGLV